MDHPVKISYCQLLRYLCSVCSCLEKEGVDDVDLEVLERADHVLNVPAYY